MAKRTGSPDAILDRLSLLRQVPSSPEFLGELRKALGHSSPVIVTRAAELAKRFEKAELVPELVAAFGNFMGDKSDADKQFVARTAIAETLLELKAGDAASAVFLRGVRCIGGPGTFQNDTAAGLRAACAFSLVNMNHPQSAALCTDLLADPAPLVRIAAVRALSATGHESLAMLFRLKLRLGDSDAEVIAECVTGMMQLAPAASLDRAVIYLRHEEPSVRAATILAIGGSRLPTALSILKDVFAHEREPDVKQTILVAAAGLRSTTAVDWLTELVSADEKTAVGAITALGPYRLDDSVIDRVKKAMQGRPVVEEAYRRVFTP